MSKQMIALKLNPEKFEDWLKIGVVGQWEGHMSGSFELSERDFKQMVLNAEELSIDIVVDYEHATIYNPEKAPASGWISTTDPISLKVEDGELYCKIDWTASAKDHVEKKEYRYLSPVFRPNTPDRVSGSNIGWTLHSVALTNTPFLTELDAITNKQPQNKENNMLKTFQEQLDDAAAKLTQLHDEIKTLKDDLKTKDEQLEEANKKLNEHKKVALTAQVDAAIAAGQIQEDQKEWAIGYALSDETGFNTFLSAQQKKDASKPEEGEMFANKNGSSDQNTEATQINMSQV